MKTMFQRRSKSNSADIKDDHHDEVSYISISSKSGPNPSLQDVSSTSNTATALLSEAKELQSGPNPSLQDVSSTSNTATALQAEAKELQQQSPRRKSTKNKVKKKEEEKLHEEKEEEKEREADIEHGEEDAAEALEEAMRDNLELMLDIVMRIRNDPPFARSIYQECPRLQHLLDENPILRPIFEDPRLVVISFENAYREMGGGDLPEDKQKKSMMAVIVKHPAFKFLRFLIFMKKCMNFVKGGGFSMMRDCFQDMFISGSNENAVLGAEHIGGDGADGADGGGDHDGTGDDGNPENRETKAEMNHAANRFEDPAMQEKLELLKSIEDPELLAEEIENDPEFRTLRDSNDLCAELMSDPDTCKIMLDPDNLRALSECPDLIELDLSSPEWAPEDNIIAAETLGEGDNIVGADVDGGFEGEGELEEEVEEEEEDVEEEEGGLEYEHGEEMNNNNNNTPAKSKGGSKANQKSRAQQRKANQGNFLTNIGVGISDMVAGELVGATLGDLTGGGGGDELAMLDGADDYGDSMMDDVENLDQAAEGADQAAEASTFADTALATGELLTEDGIADNLDNMEDGLDHVEDTHDAKQERKAAAAQNAAVGGAAAAGPAGRAVDSGTADEEEEEEGSGSKKKTGVKTAKKGFGNFMASIATAAKETVASTLLGDDFAEMLVEKIEEEESDSESDSESGSESGTESGTDKTTNDVEKGENKEDNKSSKMKQTSRTKGSAV